MRPYTLVFKTARSEYKGWENFKHENKYKQIFPVVELTRGEKIRGSEKDRIAGGKEIPSDQYMLHTGIFNLEANKKRVIDSFRKCEQIGIDITREPSLSSYETNFLSSSSNGYANWIEFCFELAKEFKVFAPSIISNPSVDETAEEHFKNLREQFSLLSEKFDILFLRVFPTVDAEFLYDIAVLRDLIKNHLEKNKNFYLILDHEFIPQGSSIIHAPGTLSIIEKISQSIPLCEFIVVGSSIPTAATDLGGELTGNFKTEELFMYDEIIKNTNLKNIIHYGDYGAINPLRNDGKYQGPPPPRIDFLTHNGYLFYHRRKLEKDEKTKKIKGDIGKLYIDIAQSVVADKRFEKIDGSWGVQEILTAASSNIQNRRSASHWISVRMEIHLNQQMRRIEDGKFGTDLLIAG